MNVTNVLFALLLTVGFCGREIPPCYNDEPEVEHHFSLLYPHKDHYHLNGDKNNCMEQVGDSTRILREVRIMGNNKIVHANIDLCERTYLKFPLDINSNFVTFLLKRDSGTDTLKFQYELFFEHDDDCGMNAFVRNVKITSSLLDPEESNEKYHDQNGEEIIIYKHHIFTAF